ncbi:hypothetical protein [Undibacterium flavidum]|uniref:Flagellar FliJ protein n=1 Tax=Undibacterium flavidum TaxID=2762297 RepID=A0ABR6YEW8_9BURK|nr:hypothetical protein [Undibacterium flavidum]MBC3875058.1 hypothetical protein [Undibacterium flavidum]
MSQGKDLRGFVYQLAPVLKVAEWELSRRQQRLALLQAELTQCEYVLRALKQAYVLEANNAKNVWNTQLDVANHGHALQYLQEKKMQIQFKTEELLRLQASVIDARAACVDQQMKLELIESHRENAIADFGLEQSKLLSSEADRDWSARSLWRKKAKVQRA